MQIRLTVLGPRSAHPGRSGHHPAPASAPHAPMGAVDVLVTAPVGTALASVAGGLADAVAAAGYEAGGGGAGGAVVLYAGGRRLDPQRCALGEPPLVDGAVLSLQGPADPDSDHYPGYPGLPDAAVADATVHLDVVAGPDAGGVHLLHGGQVRIGRSADADVPLDDPDVSRLHCAVTVAEDGRVTIADLGSTNGTAADGVPVGARPVPLAPGALLRIGESALRLRVPSATSGFPPAPARLPVHADGEGHLRVTPAEDHPTHAEGPWTGAPRPAPTHEAPRSAPAQGAPRSAPTHAAQGAWTPPARHPGAGWTRVPRAEERTGPADVSDRRDDSGRGGRDDSGRGASSGARGGAQPRAAHPAGPGDRPAYDDSPRPAPGDGPHPMPGGSPMPGDSPHPTPGAAPQGPQGRHGPGHGQDPRADRRTSAPAGASPQAPGQRGPGAQAIGQRGPGAPEDTGHGPAAADTGRRGAQPQPYGGERGDRSPGDGRAPQDASATGDRRYDDPSTTPTRRAAAPRAGAPGHTPAGQPARGGEQPRAGGVRGQGADAAPGHRHTPHGAPGTPAAPGSPYGDPAGSHGSPYGSPAAGPGSPYGSPAAGHNRQGEGGTGQPGPGASYSNNAGHGTSTGHGRQGEPGPGRQPGPGAGYNRGGQPGGQDPQGPSTVGGPADAGGGRSPYDGTYAAPGQRAPHPGDQPGAGARGGWGSAGPGRPGRGGAPDPGQRGGQRTGGAGHGDSPYGDTTAAHGRHSEGDASHGDAGRGGQPYDQGRGGQPYGHRHNEPAGPANPGQPGAAPRGGQRDGGTGYGGASGDAGTYDGEAYTGQPQARDGGYGGAAQRGGNARRGDDAWQSGGAAQRGDGTQQGRGGAQRGDGARQGRGGARRGGDRTHAGAYALDAPGAQARRRGIGAWVRQLTGKAAERGEAREDGGARAMAARAAAEVEESQRRWPDPAAVLMTALGPGPRLWERAQGHPDTLTVRLGSADRLAADGGLLPAAPVTVDLRQSGSLGLAGPRMRVAGLVRSVVAQLAALHSPAVLEIVLISGEERMAEWSWLGWLPQLQPSRGQDCRLLLAYDVEQATARTAELTRRLEDGPLGPGWADASPAAVAAVAARHSGPYTVVVVDGVPGPAALRDTLARLAVTGRAAGIHLLCPAEAPAASPTSPLPRSYEAACAASPAFAACGVAAVLSGDVATGLQIVPGGGPMPGATGVTGVTGTTGVTGATGATTTVTVDAVSAAWAERFARALAPLRPAAAGQGGAFGGPGGPPTAPLPDSARLLDELGLARATPASLMARWAAAADEVPAGGRALAVLGAGPRGPLSVDLAADGPHALIEGAAGTGKTELLRSFAASLAAAERPDRLELVLLDGAGAGAGSGTGAGEGLRVCTDLPHVSTHLAATDPVRMREFAQALSSELKRRAELLGPLDFTAWHARSLQGDGGGDGAADAGGGPSATRAGSPRTGATGTGTTGPGTTGTGVTGPGTASPGATGPGATGPGAARVVAPRPPGDIDPPPSDTLRTLNLRAQRAQRTPSASAAARPRPLPRLVVLVDDFDALVAPALGSPGRPAAGSVVRALEGIARDGARLGVHLVVASGRPDRTADTAAAERAGLRITLDPRPLDPSHPSHPAGPTHRAQPTHPAMAQTTGAVRPEEAHPGNARPGETHAGEPRRGGSEGPGAASAPSTRSVTSASPASPAAAASDGDPAPGRGRLFHPDGTAPTPFQAGRVTGRIPRTATQRPTVVPLEWRRMGDPPARRPLRELGNGPTDLALLASALQRAAQSADAPTAPALI
ncbi:FtsK/SpoIIIE domain-containing protein [Streptomyces hygroscopicus]|uniref:FtsK/SpoIIIE domain-containing protein n=1 Tax=Streptomyces hygroscopicus TaxID=1912 RepID=UPI0036CE16DE